MKIPIIYILSVAMLFASLTACGRTAPQQAPAATSTPAPEPAATPTPEPLADTEPEPEEMSQAELTKLFQGAYDSRSYTTFNTEQESINFELQYIEVEAEIAKKTLPPDYTEQYALWRAEQEEAQKPADSSEPVQQPQQSPPAQNVNKKELDQDLVDAGFTAIENPDVDGGYEYVNENIEVTEDRGSTTDPARQGTKEDLTAGAEQWDPFQNTLGVTLEYG